AIVAPLAAFPAAIGGAWSEVGELPAADVRRREPPAAGASGDVPALLPARPAVAVTVRAPAPVDAESALSAAAWLAGAAAASGTALPDPAASTGGAVAAEPVPPAAALRTVLAALPAFT